MTVFFYSFRDREILLDFFDELCGARLTTSWYRIGGVERAFTPALVEKLRQFCDYFPPKLDEYITFLDTNRIWLSRTKGVAVISAEDAINFGLSGPTLRGSSVDYDLRKFEPYAAYGECQWRSEEHTSELQSRLHLVCRLLLEKKKKKTRNSSHERSSR